MAHMKRSQGQDWARVKENVRIIGYFENEANGRIKIFTKVCVKGGMIIYHWLNDKERAEFEQHKHNYPVMDDRAKIVKESLEKIKIGEIKYGQIN